ncbi:hypothetical protein CL656_05345 [bacterium]|nr:hypothetical protein [bacterium]
MRIPLRTVYNWLLTGMPFFTYNPITQNPFNVAFTIEPQSTYINFKLNNDQTEYLNNYIHKFDENLDIVPINLLQNDNEKHNYLSVNIYNCSSPIFFNDENVITRCEINTYIKDKNTNNYGTLILDYTSNSLSMDPVNIFKSKEKTDYLKNKYYSYVKCFSKRDKISLNFDFMRQLKLDTSLHDNLIEYSDFIYYKNGIYDKLFYDSTLTKAKINSPIIANLYNFEYKDLKFDTFDSLFYFDNNIDFIGGMWNNLDKT